MAGERQPTYRALVATLRRMMSTFEETFIVLDALDEWSDAMELLNGVEEIHGLEEVCARVLTTSRKEKTIEEIMQQLTSERERICLWNEHVNADISAYITDRLQSDGSLKRWQKEPVIRTEIETTLMSKADGI